MSTIYLLQEEHLTVLYDQKGKRFLSIGVYELFESLFFAEQRDIGLLLLIKKGCFYVLLFQKRAFLQNVSAWWKWWFQGGFFVVSGGYKVVEPQIADVITSCHISSCGQPKLPRRWSVARKLVLPHTDGRTMIDTGNFCFSDEEGNEPSTVWFITVYMWGPGVLVPSLNTQYVKCVGVGGGCAAERSPWRMIWYNAMTV